MAGPTSSFRTAPMNDSTSQNNKMLDTSLVVEDAQATRWQAELTRLQEVLGLSRGEGNTVTLGHCIGSSKLILK